MLLPKVFIERMAPLRSQYRDKPKMLALALTDEERSDYAHEFDTILHAHRDTEKSGRWIDFGGLFFFFAACGMHAALDYNSFDAYAHATDLGVSTSLAAKIKRAYEIFYWRLILTTAQEAQLQAIDNFDCVAALSGVVTQQTVGDWLDYAAPPGVPVEKWPRRNDILLQTQLAHRRRKQGKQKALLPLDKLPERERKIREVNGQPIHVHDLPEWMHGSLPPDAQIEIMIRIIRF